MTSKIFNDLSNIQFHLLSPSTIAPQIANSDMPYSSSAHSFVHFSSFLLLFHPFSQQPRCSALLGIYSDKVRDYLFTYLYSCCGYCTMRVRCTVTSPKYCYHLSWYFIFTSSLHCSLQLLFSTILLLSLLLFVADCSSISSTDFAGMGRIPPYFGGARTAEQPAVGCANCSCCTSSSISEKYFND